MRRMVWPRRPHGSGVTRNVTPTEGGVLHSAVSFVPAIVRVFRPRPSDPSRASGEGGDGSDPPLFCRWCGTARGGVTPGVTSGVTSPRRWGVAPVFIVSLREGSERGRHDERRDA